MLLNNRWLLNMLASGLMVLSFNATAHLVTAVNLTDSSIDFSVNGGGGPLMSPRSNDSSSGGACCAYMPYWSPNLKVTVKWKSDKAPFNYSKNPHKRYSEAWHDWEEEDGKKNITYHKAEVIVPQYTQETAGDVVAIFLPCHQVMVVNTIYGYNSANFPEKASIQQRYKELTVLEKAGNCPMLQFPAQTKPY